MRTNKKIILFCMAIILMLSVNIAYAGGSCPWVYFWDGEKWERLSVEIGLTAGKAMDFSPTLFELPDRTKNQQIASIGELYFYREEDYLKFDNQKPINDKFYRIKLEQQAYANGMDGKLLLEHYVANLFELTTIDHPKNSVVFISQNGEVFVVDPVYWHKPISAIGSDGKDYRKQLSVHDWVNDPKKIWYDTVTSPRIPDYLDRVWDGIEGTTDYKKEEYIKNPEIYKKALEQIETSGNYLTLDFGDLSNIPPEQPLRLLVSSFFAGSSISAKSFYTKDLSGNWVLRSRELMAESKSHGIDISDWIVDRKNVQVRIMTKSDIDWAVIDASPNIKYSIHKLSPQNAVTENRDDIVEQLRSKDGKTYELWAGQIIYVDFVYNPVPKNLTRSFVFKGVGQSQLYLNGDFDKAFVEYRNSRG